MLQCEATVLPTECLQEQKSIFTMNQSKEVQAQSWNLIVTEEPETAVTEESQKEKEE